MILVNYIYELPYRPLPQHEGSFPVVPIILGKSDQKLGSIPAFGTASFEYNIRTKSLFDSYQDSIEVLVGGQKFTKEVKIIPFFIFQTIPLISIAITAAIFATYLAILGVFIYRKRLLKKQKS